MQNPCPSISRANIQNMSSLLSNGEMRFRPVIGELSRDLNFMPIDPNVQGVLLQDNAAHAPVHGQDPGLHDFRLLVEKCSVRFAINDEWILVGKAAHGIDFDDASMRLWPGAKGECFLAYQLEHPVFSYDLFRVDAGFISNFLKLFKLIWSLGKLSPYHSSSWGRFMLEFNEMNSVWQIDFPQCHHVRVWAQHDYFQYSKVDTSQVKPGML